MRRRAVPVGIALAGAEQGAVTHIQGNNATFTHARGYRAFADDVLIADVIVDGFKFIFHRHTGEETHEQERYEFAVEHSPPLTEAHVVEIVLAPFTFEIAKCGGKIRLRVLMLLTHLLYDALQFRPTTCCLVFLNGAFDCFLKLVGTIGKVLHRFCLIDVSHLLAEIARAGVDHKVNIAFIILVKLNEMVAAAE